MSNDKKQGKTASYWSKFKSWTTNAWEENKIAITGSVSAALLISSLAFIGSIGSDSQDNDQTEGQTIEHVTQTVAPTITVDTENNAVLIADDIGSDVEPEAEPFDTVIDSPEEVLDLISSLGLSDVFADEVERLGSDNVSVASQATKDIGHMLANGIDVGEDDTLANTFFQASYDMDGNTQAAHSVGYQALHGIGMDGADLELAEKMLSEANDNGHKLAAAHLDYLYQIK